jgi:hypothetical protein
MNNVGLTPDLNEIYFDLSPLTPLLHLKVLGYPQTDILNSEAFIEKLTYYSAGKGKAGN